MVVELRQTTVRGSRLRFNISKWIFYKKDLWVISRRVRDNKHRMFFLREVWVCAAIFVATCILGQDMMFSYR